MFTKQDMGQTWQIPNKRCNSNSKGCGKRPWCDLKSIKNVHKTSYNQQISSKFKKNCE